MPVEVSPVPAAVDADPGQEAEDVEVVAQGVDDNQPGCVAGRGQETLALPVHALSLAEAAALVRELPNLRALPHQDSGLIPALRAVDRLDTQPATAEAAAAGQQLEASFRDGESTLDPGQFQADTPAAAADGGQGTIADQAVQEDDREDSALIVRAGLPAAPYLQRCRDWDTAGRLLEMALSRDQSPGTVQAALPPLRRIADATRTSMHEANLGRALSGAARVSQPSPPRRKQS